MPVTGRLEGSVVPSLCQGRPFSPFPHKHILSEQAFWASLYLFAVSASGAWIHWSGLAFIQLILLFQGSTGLTEDLALAKYPK